MFNRFESINEWCQSLASKGLEPSTIKELQSHLEESIERMISDQGMSESDAFNVACKQIGSPHALSTEFRKLGSLLPADWAALIMSLALLTALTCVVGTIILSPKDAVAKNLLLSSHVATTTLGYAVMLLLAITGAYSVFRRICTERSEFAWFNVFVPLCRWAAFTGFALVSIGLITGCIWSRESRGAYWSWSPKEIGSLCVWLWYAGNTIWLSINSAQPKQLPAIVIFGGIVCLGAWFGTNGFASAPAFLLINLSQIMLLFVALRLFSKSEPGALIS